MKLHGATPEEVLLYLHEYRQKMGVRDEPAVSDVADEGPESRLADRIMEYCKERGYPCQCFRKSRKAIGFLVPGWWD